MKSPLALAMLLGLAGSASAAITLAGGNGSFETGSATTSAGPSWGAYPLQTYTPTNWTLTEPGGLPYNTAKGNAAWLLNNNSGYGASSDGDFFINVEQGPNWWLSAQITGLTIGNTYTVNFDMRRRDINATGTLDVFVNSSVSATSETIGATGGFDFGASSTTVWEQKSFDFIATDTSSYLILSNTDFQGGNGLMVDNFSVIPEPSAALLGGLGLLGLLRRKR